MAKDLFAPPSEEELFSPPPPATAKAAGSEQDLFAPPKEEELFAPPPLAGSTVDKEIAERSFFDRPALGAESTKSEEIAAIAKKHGVDPKELESLAPYFGARMEGSGFISGPELKRAAGGVGGVLLNVPQKLYKKAQGGAMEAALDDVQALASGRQSYSQLVGEAAVPGVGVGLSAASRAGKIAGGAATGALAGYSGSSREQEGLGLLFGAGVGGAASALAAKLAARKGAPAVEKEAAIAVLRREAPDLDKGTTELLQKRMGSEKDIQRLIEGSAELDQTSANRIVKEQLDSESLAKYLSQETEEGKLIRDRLARTKPEQVESAGFEKAIEQELAEQLVERRAKDFAESLDNATPRTLEEAQSSIKEYASRQGAEATKERYRLFVEEKAALDYIKDKAVRGGRKDNFIDRALNFLSDSQFVLRDIDEQLGTRLEQLQQRMSNASNRMSFPRQEFRADLDTIFRSAPELDKDIAQSSKLYDALDSGSTAGLSPKEQQIAQAFKEYFAKGLDYVNRLVKEKDPSIAPLAIPKRENYVPHLLADTDVLIAKVDQKVQDLLKQASQSYGRPVRDLAELRPQEFKQLAQTPEAQELIKGLQIFDAKAINSASELSARIKDTFDSKAGRLKLETTARAALERQGQIPTWMRETNLYRLADKWASNTLKHLYLRKEMDAMRSMALRLEKAGATMEADYVKNLLSDINGVRRGSMSERTRQLELSYYKALDQLAAKNPNPFAQGVIASAKAIPEVLGDLNKQIYPNLLGLSPRALIMNATQPIAKTMPELGAKYGPTTVLRGAMYAVLNAKQVLPSLAKEGLVPAEFVGKYRQAVADGIRRNQLYAVPNRVLDGLGQGAMYLYSKMDLINRGITRGTAEVMAADLAKGNKLAQQALRKFPTTVQRAVAAEPARAAEIIGSHLNASTQYNYNRISMSEFGRYMGPLFSTFSKWPTATLGEHIAELRSKGLIKGSLRNAEKFIAPFVLFKLADYMMYGADPEQQSDRQKLLLGKGGLSGSAPIGAIGSIAKGDFFTPPAVDAIIQSTVVPMLQGDGDKASRGLSSAIQNFTPGSVYARFLLDDLPTLLTGDRPAGDTFIERTASGIKKATK